MNEGTVEITVADFRDLQRLRDAEALGNAQALSAMPMSGGSVDPDAGWPTVERIQLLRLALRGLGRVGNHFDAEGKTIGQQIVIVLGPHEAESLIMQLSGELRHTETVGGH